MMQRRLFIAIFSLCLVSISVARSSAEVKITSPEDGDSVQWRTVVKGSVSGTVDEVWVVVHPMTVSSYFVQPRLSVKKDGSWRVNIFVGNSGSKEAGTRFEIRAVSNPEKELKEGTRFGFWPEAETESEIIEVIRK